MLRDCWFNMDFNPLCLIFSREHLVHYKRFVKTQRRTLIMTVRGPLMFSFPNSYSSSNTTVPKSGKIKNRASGYCLSNFKEKVKLEFEVQWIEISCLVSKKLVFMSILVLIFTRSHAIACVNQFIISRTQALMVHIDSFIEVSLHSNLKKKKSTSTQSTDQGQRQYSSGS